MKYLFTLHHKVLQNKIMSQSDQHLEDIQVIRKIMEESSRFLSLSGLSGIMAGLLGIAGAVVAQLIITKSGAPADWYMKPLASGPEGLVHVCPSFWRWEWFLCWPSRELYCFLCARQRRADTRRGLR